MLLVSEGFKVKGIDRRKLDHVVMVLPLKVHESAKVVWARKP